MPTEISVWVAYGAPGILVLLAIGASKLGLRMVDRWFMLADKIEAMLVLYKETVLQQDVNAERRAAGIMAALQENRSVLNSSIRELQTVIIREAALGRDENPHVHRRGGDST